MGASLRLLWSQWQAARNRPCAPACERGSHRVAHLVIACHACNQHKGDQSIEAFLAHRPEVLDRIQAQCHAPLKDAAIVNSTRWAIYERLKALALPLETSSGGVTKWNRQKQGLPKEHWVDAACCGTSTPALYTSASQRWVSLC